MADNDGHALKDRRLVIMMAFATGALVANLYYAQPLEETLARAFNTSSGAIGIIITIIQISYALGLATLVPLGDLLERRRLLVAMLSCATLGLIVMALAPSLTVFGAAAALVGLTSVAAQVIVPFAAHIAAAGQQGRVVSTVLSGLLLGILLSRTVSGFVATVAGWRAVFVFGAVVTAGVTIMLWRELPKLKSSIQMPYRTLLGSVLQLVREEPVLRLRMLYGALTFSSFCAFWASAGFLLARAPYEWSNAEIGAFALLGAVGAMAAKFAGRLADRGLAHLATGGFVLLMALSYVLMAMGVQSAVALGLGVILMDLGTQGTHISNLSLFYPLRPEARSRLNTAYMTSYFIAGAIGSGLSTAVYPVYGWLGVCVVGAVFPALAFVVWLMEIRLKHRSAPADLVTTA